jgi:hypothetical protein
MSEHARDSGGDRHSNPPSSRGRWCTIVRVVGRAGKRNPEAMLPMDFESRKLAVAALMVAMFGLAAWLIGDGDTGEGG